jgi:hypothetical protein
MFLSTLAIRETLQYAAGLQLPSPSTSEQKLDGGKGNRGFMLERLCIQESRKP